MPMTEIDEHVALICIDLQKGILAFAEQIPAIDTALENSVRLVEAFRAKGQTVVLVNVVQSAAGRVQNRFNFTPPPDWAELSPKLNVQPTDVLVSKKGWGAFLSTDLHAQLQARGITQVVFTGVSTCMGVDSSARSAFDLGYNVVIVEDAVADINPSAAPVMLAEIYPRMAELDSTDGVLKLLGA